MRYYKFSSDGYLLGFGTGDVGKEISESEYNEIVSFVTTKPPRTETTDYRLRDNLTWEPYAVEPEPEPELDEAEAWEIIFGGGGE